MLWMVDLVYKYTVLKARAIVADGDYTHKRLPIG